MEATAESDSMPQSGIPASFSSVTELLYVMIEIAGALRSFDDQWSHLKNKEDYGHIFSLPPPVQNPLDELYCVGRQFATDFSGDLTSLYRISEAPTLTIYVEIVETRLKNRVPELERVYKNAYTAISELKSHSYAVGRMCSLLKKQIELSRVAQDNCELLKRSSKYMIEQGKLNPGEQPRRFWDKSIVIALSATLLAGLLAVMNTHLGNKYEPVPPTVVCEQPLSNSDGSNASSITAHGV